MQASNPIKPSHYKNGEHDLLWHLKDLLTIEEFRGAMKMNIIKYTMRYENKNGIEDLEKANQYIKVLKEFEQELLDRGDSVNDYNYMFSEEELDELNQLYDNFKDVYQAECTLFILRNNGDKEEYPILTTNIGNDGYTDTLEKWWSNYESK